jgi:hypothetical protein
MYFIEHDTFYVIDINLIPEPTERSAVRGY